METLQNYLRPKCYPGRGIYVGKTDKNTVLTAYFIMGRSPNSQNRVFVLEDDFLKTKAFDESKVKDPSLIIYNCSRVFGELDIITNGDQTDTIFDMLNVGGTFEEALITRRYEPDPPNFTPRISALVNHKGSKLGICRGDESGDNPGDVRCFFEYPHKDGFGHIIHTYRGEEDGVLLPYIGEPTEVTVSFDNIENFANNLWESLDKDNRVSLFVRTRDLTTGESKTKIINKNQ